MIEKVWKQLKRKLIGRDIEYSGKSTAPRHMPDHPNCKCALLPVPIEVLRQARARVWLIEHSGSRRN